MMKQDETQCNIKLHIIILFHVKYNQSNLCHLGTKINMVIYAALVKYGNFPFTQLGGKDHNILEHVLGNIVKIH